MKLKMCESCGAAFECGSEDTEPCWCNGYDVSQENLRKLRAEYKDCLCEPCLVKMAGACKNT